ncbi:hypothetical protein TSAR_015202 [Trichomalopsis sarcophagae]|uniref:Uncharacterized protein n=1 Tax=Trichomalopsis sarcophagae TaxID=543379 RepID=A0A232FGD3_9HYME|nr:hypothetical protein TSAR_015202 [Trichomalopsis sarcophagae]
MSRGGGIPMRGGGSESDNFLVVTVNNFERFMSVLEVIAIPEKDYTHRDESKERGCCISSIPKRIGHDLAQQPPHRGRAQGNQATYTCLLLPTLHICAQKNYSVCGELVAFTTRRMQCKECLHHRNNLRTKMALPVTIRQLMNTACIG